jgi:hypothetical protein
MVGAFLLLNPDYAIGIVTRVESAIKTGIPASILFESVATPYGEKKIRGNSRICSNFGLTAVRQARSRFSIA